MFGLSELAQASRLDVGLAVFGGKEDRLDSETQARSLEAVVRLYPGENATRSLRSGISAWRRETSSTRARSSLRSRGPPKGGPLNPANDEAKTILARVAHSRKLPEVLSSGGLSCGFTREAVGSQSA